MKVGGAIRNGRLPPGVIEFKNEHERKESLSAN